MATWTGAYISDLPASAFACPDSRKYPHHDAAGKLDLPHLRAALSRIGDPDNEQCGKAHLEAHAKEAGMGERKALVALKAHPIDDDAFRLLAIPFGGPTNHLHSKAEAPLGHDLDGEWFSERTDIKAAWLPFRPVDWHHQMDSKMGRTILGKAELDDEPEEDGWWVTVWLKHGERRLSLVRRLAEKGAELFGSSEAVPSLIRKASTGEILAWPYIRQAISTSPQNTLSVIRPLKATIDDLAAGGDHPTAAFFDDLERLLGDLTGPDFDLAGEESAKAGRVLASRNEARLREASDDLEVRGWDPVVRKRALAKMAAVLDELTRYVNTPEENQ